MTHTETTEAVERLVEEYLKEFPPMPDDLIGCVFNREAVAEFNLARLRSSDWVRTALTTIRKETLEEARQAVEAANWQTSMEELKGSVFNTHHYVRVKHVNAKLLGLKATVLQALKK